MLAEAPAISTMNGVSLMFTRLELEAVVGAPVQSRPLKASLFGEFYEYTYEGGLIVGMPDRNPGSHPTMLLGTKLASRGQAIPVGLTAAELEAQLGEPTEREDWRWAYRDPDRQTQLLAFFEEGKVTRYAVTRLPKP